MEDTKKPIKITDQVESKMDKREENKEEDLEEEKGLEEIVQEVNLLDGNSVQLRDGARSPMSLSNSKLLIGEWSPLKPKEGSE